MGKPRLIILIRHAQSEGNKNRAIHQMVPDHRVKLTDDGWQQAEDAGRRLRHLLKPDDTLQIYTSPYRRTRETTEGILRTLTARNDPNDPAPSPFSRSKIKVYEEPRVREQDFGNFQPCSAEMERMWRERSDYGHFFYRIPNGESAADAYDRISGFNESLWRQFGEKEFPSVCVIVTHGLMSRVFLMKWYHWSVEYFEDLRNVNHCEFIVMQQNPESGKFLLQNQLRTWSELKRQKAQQNRAEEARKDPQRRNTLSSFLAKQDESPSIPPQQWGGCLEGCNHNHEQYPRRGNEIAAAPEKDVALPPAAVQSQSTVEPAHEGPTASQGPSASKPGTPGDEIRHSRNASYLLSGRDGGGGDMTPHEMSDAESDGSGTSYFDPSNPFASNRNGVSTKTNPQRKPTVQDIERWATESGMGRGTQADPLGDEAGAPDDNDDDDAATSTGPGSTVVESLAHVDLHAAEVDDKSVRGSVY
nr:broad-range acid phosphatase det1 [Quercus suber]